MFVTNSLDEIEASLIAEFLSRCGSEFKRHFGVTMSLRPHGLS